MIDKYKHLMESCTTRSLRALFAALLLAVVAAGCIRNEFEVKIDLPAEVNGAYRVVYYARDKRGGVTLETAVAVSKGKGELKGMTRLPVCVMIFEGSASAPSALFYAERGDKISITGKSADPSTWEISGNDLSEALTQWRRENAGVLGKKDPGAINGIVEKFVKANPSDPLSALLLAAFFDRSADGGETRFRRLLGSLKGDAATEEILSLTGRTDMTAGSSGKVDRLPDRIVLQTQATGCDTVRLRAGKPSMIVCRQSDDDADRILADTLRSVAKASSDSLRRNLVEMYMAADSVTWNMALRRDTLRGVVRARAPRELAEPSVALLGVPKAPWIIVADGKGKIIYAGDNPALASSKFRSLIRKKR